MNKICIYHKFEAKFCCNFTVDVFCILTLTRISVCEVIKLKGKVFYTFDGILPWGFRRVQFICLQQCSEKKM
jgi:hypothetical protein